MANIKDEGMSNIQFAVGAAVLLGLLALFVGIAMVGGDAAESVGEDSQKMISSAEMKKYSAYNNTTINGTGVATALDMYRDQAFGVIVRTKGNDSGVNYLAKLEGVNTGDMDDENKEMITATGVAENWDEDASAYNGNLKKTKDKTSKDYIKPSADFDSKLIISENDEVIGIMFKQK